MAKDVFVGAAFGYLVIRPKAEMVRLVPLPPSVTLNREQAEQLCKDIRVMLDLPNKVTK